MHGGFENYKFSNFKTNLKNLINTVEKDKQASARDETAFMNDIAILGGHPTQKKKGGPIRAAFHLRKYCQVHQGRGKC